MRRFWLLLLLVAAAAAAIVIVRQRSSGSGTTEGSFDASAGNVRATSSATARADDDSGNAGSRSALCVSPAGDAAEVDDMRISVEALCARLARLGPTVPTVDRAHARTVLDQMIDVALVRRALSAEGASVSDADLTKGLLELGVREPPDGGSRDAGVGDARAPSVDPALREQVRERLELKKLVEVRKQIKVTDDEVAAEMAKGAPGIDRGQGMRVAGWIARMSPDADPTVQATAERTARDFARAVQTEPAEAAAARLRMSKLEPFVVGANGVEPELEQAAFSLKEGDWSAPIRTRVGWVVMRVIERVEARPMNEDLLRARVRVALENRKLQAAREDLVGAMRTLARIRIIAEL